MQRPVSGERDGCADGRKERAHTRACGEERQEGSSEPGGER